ncbi:uncharacterized protein LOC128199736 [Bicyclus anynana]|uniref:Uncharacterized protein LOC128199736 n=1 Tax=Bicyclus anynana TaxID=110368 RepID=A0ABM3M6M9_BICAN|nr:uncharacterized protein LOC128199736 [Bicyclus anynana]
MSYYVLTDDQFEQGRKFLSTQIDQAQTQEGCSGWSEETCEWAGDVRALRDSHVRLVLQQLRQLRDVERLRRTLRRAHCVFPHSYNESHLGTCVAQFTCTKTVQSDS